MKLAKGLAWLGLTIISGAIIYGFLYGDFMADGAELLSNVWGRVTLIDIYISFFVIIGWVVYREKHMVWKIVWPVLILTLGSYAICLYILIALYRCHNNPRIFFMGKRV